MNLVGLYMNLGLEGIPSAELKSILQGNHSVRVLRASNGMVMLSSKKIIKCVSNYYEHPQNKIQIKASNQCYYVQKAFGVEAVGTNRCDTCHIQCMNMQEAKRIYRK